MKSALEAVRQRCNSTEKEMNLMRLERRTRRFLEASTAVDSSCQDEDIGQAQTADWHASVLEELALHHDQQVANSDEADDLRREAASLRRLNE